MRWSRKRRLSHRESSAIASGLTCAAPISREIPSQPRKEAGNLPPQALASAFEAAIREADRLADLLRADTERATTLEATRQRIADMQAEMQRNEDQRERLAGKRRDLQHRWEALVAPLRRSDLPPAALREWLSRHQRLVERHGDLESLRAERGAVDTDITEPATFWIRRCWQVTGCLDSRRIAAGAFARAQQAVNAARKARADRDSVTEQIQAGTAELRDLQKQREQTAGRLAEWKLKWGVAAEGLRLTKEAVPAEAKTRLDQFSRLSAALTELSDLLADSSEHESVVTGFETKVSDIARAVAEAAEGQSPDNVAERLYGALADTRSADSSRQQVVNDIERETRTTSEADVAAAQARNALNELVQQAGCQTTEQLPEIEGRAARKQSLQQRLHEIESSS